jgi:hypothetical protein
MDVGTRCLVAIIFLVSMASVWIWSYMMLILSEKKEKRQK